MFLKEYKYVVKEKKNECITDKIEISLENSDEENCDKENSDEGNFNEGN